MLLSEFTWWQFATIATILTVLWYTGVLLLFFREEIKSALGLKPRESQPPNSTSQKWNDATEDVMGATKAPEGMTETYEVSFASVPRESRIGTVPDFLKDLSEILEIVKKESGTKEDLIGMLNDLRHSYPTISTVENWDSIVVHIQDNTPFPLTEEEIKDIFQ